MADIYPSAPATQRISAEHGFSCKPPNAAAYAIPHARNGPLTARRPVSGLQLRPAGAGAAAMIGRPASAVASRPVAHHSRPRN